MKIHLQVQKITHETIFWTFQSAIVTLKIKSMSPKPKDNQKIMHGNEKVDADANTNPNADGIHTKNNISPHPLGLGGHDFKSNIKINENINSNALASHCNSVSDWIN